jgi:hypothetical protein
MNRLIATVLLVVIALTPWQTVHAQGIPVFDVANLAQLVKTAERTAQTILAMKQQYDLWVRMGTGIGSLDRYRILGIPTFGHDAGRFLYGQPWIEALDSGDARGDRYYATVQPLSRLVTSLATLTSPAKRAVTADYATVEILDSVAMMGAHQSAIVRAYSGKVQGQIDSLEGDVTNPNPDFHELTAVADKIAVGEVLGRRLDMANNQLLSHALEQLVAKSKRQRDAEAGAMNGRITILQDQGKTNRRLVDGADRALTTWRQP